MPGNGWMDGQRDEGKGGRCGRARTKEEIQQARWIGWRSSSSSWSRELGTLSALMNNGEEAREGGGEKKKRDGDGRRRRRRRRRE